MMKIDKVPLYPLETRAKKPLTERIGSWLVDTVATDPSQRGKMYRRRVGAAAMAFFAAGSSLIIHDLRNGDQPEPLAICAAEKLQNDETPTYPEAKALVQECDAEDTAHAASTEEDLHSLVNETLDIVLADR